MVDGQSLQPQLEEQGPPVEAAELPSALQHALCDPNYARTAVGAELWKVSKGAGGTKFAVEAKPQDRQADVAKGFAMGRCATDMGAEGFRGIVRAVNAEWSKALQGVLGDMQRWQVQLELQISKTLGEASLGVRRVHEELGELERELLTGQKELATKQASCDEELHRLVRDLTQRVEAAERLRPEVSACCDWTRELATKQAGCDAELHRLERDLTQRVEATQHQGTELGRDVAACRARAQELATKQASCDAELHRLVRDLTQKVEAAQGLGTGLGKDVGCLRSEISACRDWAREQIDASIAQQASQADKACGSLEQRLAIQLSALDSRVVAANDLSSGFSAALATVERQLASAGPRMRECVEAEIEREMATTDSSMRRKFDALAKTVEAVELRLAAEDTALRGRIEDRVMEEAAGVLAMVKPVARSIHRLARAFDDLGLPQVKSSREFEFMEHVVKDAESRVLPWTPGHHEWLQRVRAAAPRSEAQPVAPRPALCDAGEPGRGSPVRLPGPRRPASARPAVPFRASTVPEWCAVGRPMSANLNQAGVAAGADPRWSTTERPVSRLPGTAPER